MTNRRGISLLLTLSLLAHAFSVPVEVLRYRRGYSDNEVNSKEHGAGFDLVAASSVNRKVRQNDETTATELHLSLTTTTDKPSPAPSSNDDDDDDDFEPMNTSSTTGGGGGSNIFSLLRLAGALFPGSSSANDFLRNLMREFLYRNQGPIPMFMRRSDDNVADNEIDIDYDKLKPPPLQRQETEETVSESESGSESESLQDTEEDIDNAAEESVENNGNKNNEDGKKSKQESASNADNSDYDDDDEPPGGGDGQGGGILGILAGLSGGGDGQSDLGSLLAAVSGIVVNLSGDGIDLNAIIASGLGLFVGLLSEGEENPGAVIAQYLLTSLETITGGGSQNNGAFFGNFLSKLIQGTSAGMNPDASSEDKPPMKDSAGFFISLLMGLLGDMSKGSSSSKPWERALEMRR